MKKRDKKNKIPFAARKSSWLIVLVAGMLAIILIPRIVILAKYSLDLFDYTGVVANDFHFTSDYLSDLNTGSIRTQTITGWNGEPQTARAEIRNFDNALRYNDADTDVWYYFDVSLYYGDNVHTISDEAQAVKDGTLFVNEEAKYTITIDAKDTSATTAATTTTTTAAGSATTTAAATTAEASVLKAQKLYTYVDPVTGKNYPCICLNGIEGLFDRTKGTHYLSVDITDFGSDEVEKKDQRVSIQVHTITADKLSGIKNVEYKKSNEISKDADPKEGISAEGVYECDMKGIICYTHSIDVQKVSATYEKTEDTSRLHYYNLYCTSVSGTSSRIVRVYYDSKVFDFSPQTASPSKADTTGATPQAGRVYKFFEIEIQANNSQRLKLLTDWEGAGPAGGGDSALKIGLDGPTERVSAMNAGLDMWFEVLGQEAETIATTTAAVHNLVFYTEHYADNDALTLNGEWNLAADTGRAGFVYVADMDGSSPIGKDTKINYIRLYVEETGILTVGKVKIAVPEGAEEGDENKVMTITDSVRIKCDADDSGAAEVSLGKTFTLAENEYFFVGAPGDTVKVLYRYQITTDEEGKPLDPVTDNPVAADYYFGIMNTTTKTVQDPDDSSKTIEVTNYFDPSMRTTNANLTVDFGYQD